MKKYFLVLLLIITSCTIAHKIPNEFKARVIKVRDGDTVEVLYKKQIVVIRLEHIDCPERGQPFSKKAQQFTNDFCYNKRVNIISKGKFDRYKRLIGEVVIKDKNLNEELVKKGYALHYKKYSNNQIYSSLEEQARNQKEGIWSQQKLIEPWLYRKNRKEK